MTGFDDFVPLPDGQPEAAAAAAGGVAPAASTNDVSAGPGSRAAQPAASVGARFRAAWTGEQDPATASVEMLPTRLTKACVRVLPVDGAGLGLITGAFRVPLGASDAVASLAERMQFTHGEGPCLQACAAGAAVYMRATDIAGRWPQFAHELFRDTPYRAVLSVPLLLGIDSLGALDLYLHRPGQLTSADVADAFTIAEHIVDALLRDLPEAGLAGPNMPSWLRTGTAPRRTRVWVAMGIVMERHRAVADDALALLRARAYSLGIDVDEVAAELVAGTIDLDELP